MSVPVFILILEIVQKGHIHTIEACRDESDVREADENCAHSLLTSFYFSPSTFDDVDIILVMIETS